MMHWREDRPPTLVCLRISLSQTSSDLSEVRLGLVSGDAVSQTTDQNQIALGTLVLRYMSIIDSKRRYHFTFAGPIWKFDIRRENSDHGESSLINTNLFANCLRIPPKHLFPKRI